MKLFVAIPCQGSFSVEFNASLMNMMQRYRNTFSISICKSPGIGVSRNILTGDFLESDCDKMLMIDSDVLFTPAHIERITSHAEDVVGGLYAKKEKEGRPCCETLPGVDPVPNGNGLIPLKYIGTGFMCVSKGIVEKMKKMYSYDDYVSELDGRKLHDWWKVGVHPEFRRYLTEDWWFCQRALDLGYKVWGDSQVTLQHEGRCIYPLELNEPRYSDEKRTGQA